MHDIFFFTDIHGQYSLFRAIMDYCYRQDPEAMIIFGGDACDRGAGGYTIIKELLNNPKVVYLKGNHEDMFCKAAREILEKFNFENSSRDDIKKVLNACRNFDYRYVHIQDCIGNGGINTLLDWIEDGKSLDIIKRLENLPYTFQTETCDFCHAAGVPRVFNEAAEAEYNGIPVDPYTQEALLWSRTAYDMGWTDGRTVLFGHTPVPFILEDLHVKDTDEDIVRPYKYTGTGPTGTKIAMDTGAVFLGYAWVINILTMKAQGFFFDDETKIVKEIECIQM